MKATVLIKRISPFFLCLMSLGHSFAQKEMPLSLQCLTDTLNISTGYMPYYYIVNHSDGAQDSKWKVGATSGTPISPTVGSPAIINIPVTTITFPTQQHSAWISFGGMTVSAYFANTLNTEYYAFFDRSFTTCSTDTILLDMQSVSRDNWIDSIYIDNVALPWTDPFPDATVSNYTSFSNLSVLNLGVLPQGTHKLSFKVSNSYSTVFPKNYHGLNMQARIFSKGGNKVIVKEIEDCKDYVCQSGETSIGAYADKNLLLNQNYPNPASHRTSIHYGSLTARHKNIITITTLLGKEVQTIELQGTEGNINIDVSSMAPGIYIYSLAVDGVRMASRKLVVNR